MVIPIQNAIWRVVRVSKKKTDIEKFEGDYDLKGFISFLRESCTTRNQLERDKEDLKKEVGMHSYDGQVMMLEAEVNKFLKKIVNKTQVIKKIAGVMLILTSIWMFAIFFIWGM